jgi:toxin ParE1/3/4
MRLTWRPQAALERSDAIDYIAEDNPSAALDQLDRIEEQVDTLLQQPRLGRPGRVKGTRELVISRTPFIIIYRLQGTRHIEILRLLHGAQQWPPAAAAARKDRRK